MAFEYPANFSDGNTVEGIGSFFQYAHYVSDGFLGYAILIIIFMMALIVGLTMGTKRALLSSSFITFIFSVYFWRLEMISPAFVFAFVFIMIISAIGIKSEGSNI